MITKTYTPTGTPTNTPLPGSLMHVGDLDGSRLITSPSRWDAAVIITTHDSSESLVVNATVSGLCSNGATGTDYCTTTSNGQCSITKSPLRSNISSVTFTVVDVVHISKTYQPSANHNPDGTSIIVYKDGLPTLTLTNTSTLSYTPTSTATRIPTPAMLNNSAHYIFNGFTPIGKNVVQIEFRYFRKMYQIRGVLYDDNVFSSSTDWYNISDAPHSIELYWWASDYAGANNGGLRNMLLRRI